MPQMARLRKNFTINAPVSITSSPIQQPQMTTVPTAKSKLHVLLFIEKTKDGIDPDCISKVETELANIQKSKEVLLIIHTLGGDVYSSVRIIRIIQQKFLNIKAIIPDYAFSSGTIMSLGG
jgi:ClpP class serine protease